MLIRLFLEDQEGGAQDLLPDKEWTVLWTDEDLPKVAARMPTIHLHYFGGIRHKKGPWGGKSFQYGFRVPRTWFFSGEAQTSLLPAEQRPRPSNAGVIGDYL